VKYIQKHNEYVKHEIVPRVQAAGGCESADVAADYLDELFSTFIGMNDVGNLSDIAVIWIYTLDAMAAVLRTVLKWIVC
jgi:hypothetical protein